MYVHQSIEAKGIPRKIVPYQNKYAPLLIRNYLFSLIPKGTQSIYVIGIGSSKIIGDSLGPFVGSLLADLYPEHLTTLGTLDSPLDATTLSPKLTNLSLPTNSFVIAIDSAIGIKSHVHSIVIEVHPLQPGKALNHELPPVGDCSILGVVLERGDNIGSNLLHTDLNHIYHMSKTIAIGISLTIRQYFRYPANYLILN